MLPQNRKNELNDKLIRIRAGKLDFWKSISKAAAQGALNRFYPPCIVNAASDVLDG